MSSWNPREFVKRIEDSTRDEFDRLVREWADLPQDQQDQVLRLLGLVG